MSAFAFVGPVVAIIALFLVTEVLTAVLPLILVITLVPPHERPGLAAVLSAANSGGQPRRSRWRQLRNTMTARRAAQAGRYSTSGRPGPP
ncbi:hypothetical protein Acy02nite_70500 [Actinoplanes cyaneus]|uniref:Uncharacterized protein n=1 Tax=Actinoplanes cyaneus TaxID=52696 RepID=A0A919MB21_9ACTN|nr:hypothetical protein [Actinoplanes cyaneus]MCW2140916.1 hypothetical protein [Actinoplanes cyaneus]GID69169.1 hypothetical protein Acy02nite_70500 [Actinoplanes cyaneus]